MKLEGRDYALLAVLRAAGAAGLFMAASGPLVAFTCHYGRYGVTSRWMSDYGIHYMVLEPK